METSMNKVLITTSSFGKIDTSPLDKLKANNFDIVLNPFGRKLIEEEILALILEHEPYALLAGVEPLTAKVLEAASPELKTISRCGIGMDSVDINAAKGLGITVTNTPDAPTIPVVELTVGMILGLLRQIHVTDVSIREDRWERPMGMLLYGKTVGIIGCGRIGTRLARALQGFGCTVLGADPVKPECADFQLVEINQLLTASDIISLHLPYSAGTNHFMDTNRISMMKKGAYLINAARGGLVDEDALYRALKSDHLAGAALDCFEQEPYKGPLKELKNILLTAHIGSYAREGRIMMEMQAADNLLQELKNQGVAL
jgi:D-3-phosphoglycerate dehydrogenase / 2-oxoglutarate reductase